MLLLEPHPARVRARAERTRVLQSADLRTARITAHIHQPPETRKSPYAKSGRKRRTIRYTSAGHLNMRFVGRYRESGRTLWTGRRSLKRKAARSMPGQSVWFTC